jgi:hypothetical protein
MAAAGADDPAVFLTGRSCVTSPKPKVFVSTLLLQMTKEGCALRRFAVYIAVLIFLTIIFLLKYYQPGMPPTDYFPLPGKDTLG